MTLLVWLCSIVAVLAFLWFLHYLREPNIQSQSTPDSPPGRELTPYSSPTFSPITTPEEHRHFFLQVHGIYHRNSDGASRQQAIKRCLPGELLQFVPEPDNPVDPYAIKVCRKSGEQLGYLDSGNAMRITGDLSIGWTYRVTVEEIFATNRAGYFGCKIRIGVLTMSTKTEARKKKLKQKTRTNQKS